MEKERCPKCTVIRTALKQHANHYQDYSLTFIQKWFYTFKFVICWFLPTRPNEDYPDVVEVAIFNGRYYYSESCSNAYSWEYLAVGHGILKNWFAYSDGDTNC